MKLLYKYDNLHKCIATATYGLTVLLFGFTVGCTSTQVEYGQFKVKRTSFMQSVNLKAIVSADGDISISYANDGGGEQTGKAIGAAAKTMVK